MYEEEKEQYKRKYKTLGYYETKQLALHFLAEYYANPYDIDGDGVTFKERCDKGAEEYLGDRTGKRSAVTLTGRSES